jgi:hypothetical protein
MSFNEYQVQSARKVAQCLPQGQFLDREPRKPLCGIVGEYKIGTGLIKPLSIFALCIQGEQMMMGMLYHPNRQSRLFQPGQRLFDERRLSGARIPGHSYDTG